jgi:hypothetical protein
VLLAAVMTVSSEASLRLLAVGASALALGFSTYYVVRMVQELSKADAAEARFSAFGRSLPVSEHIGVGPRVAARRRGRRSNQLRDCTSG